MTDEMLPAYIAFIRRELKLPPGSDALIELHARLYPADERAKPPYRAPGIVRLRHALKRLETHKAPSSLLEEFAADLRFLQMFSMEKPVLPGDAMQKLLSEVMNSPPIKKSAASTSVAGEPDDNVLPFRPKKPQPGGQP